MTGWVVSRKILRVLACPVMMLRIRISVEIEVEGGNQLTQAGWPQTWNTRGFL